MGNESLDSVWKENPEYIRNYYDVNKRYEKLCNEIEYTVSVELDAAEIKYAHIVSRVKSLKSFCEKISRKNYKNPFIDITDLAGVRIVFLYIMERERIESIIENSFKIIEKVDKVSSEEVDKFGYGALHYLVKIKMNSIGARYDELKDLVCEIQVRTILQDAWAIVAHHLSYKQESDIPKELRRKLNALSGLFETADDQFQNIKKEREDYQYKVKDSISSKGKGSLDKDINIDNLTSYLMWKFPDRKNYGSKDISELLTDLKDYDNSTLSMVDLIVDRSINAIKALEKKYLPTDEDTDEKTIFSAVGIVRSALCFTNPEYLTKTFSGELLEHRKEFMHMVKKDA